MVRQIRSCVSCRQRFLSTCAHIQCKQCRRTETGKTEQATRMETSMARESCVQRDEDDDSGRQPDALPQTEPRLNKGKTVGNDDVCFICGASFKNISTGLKGRTNHIKRCSKKYGVTGRDVKVNDDDDFFINATSSSAKTASAKESINPYVHNDDSWHEGADVDLQLASDLCDSSCMTVQATSNPAAVAMEVGGGSEFATKQSSLKKFFPTTKLRSLTNVLLAGARRANKTADIASKRDMIHTSSTTQSNGGRYQKRRRIDYSKVVCPSYKKIPGTDFVCDGFMYARSSLSEKYFLTHFHSDHYGGITSSWNAGVIYCSLPTANLVHQQLGVDRKYLHPLGMMTPAVIESKGRPVQVTLIDANHCPGAVMFLFEVGKRRILHVGDFRWNRDAMLRHAPLRAFSTQQERLDDLFLDTTYCNEKYALPSQEEAIRATEDLAVKEWEASRRKGEKTLFLFGAYTIGKERLFLSVAERLHMKVYVDKKRFRILSALNWPQERLALLTTVKEETCLWVVPLGHINFKNMPSIFDASNDKVFTRRYDRVVGFRPTGWSMAAKGNGLLSSRSQGIFSVHGVPYSEHSSFPELVDCIACLKPKKITPTVSVSSSSEQVDRLLRGLTQKTLWNR